MVLTYSLLVLSITALWTAGDSLAPFARRNLWLFLLSASLVTAFAEGVVNPAGLLWAALFAAAVWSFFRPGAGRWQIVAATVAVLVLAAGLMLHRLPGFNNLRVISEVRFSPDAVPYTLYLNYDKTLAGIILLGWGHSRITRARDWRVTLATTAPWALGLMGLIMVLSLAAGYVRFEPKFPAQAWLWMGANLGFTCLAEEALFRGFVQAQLQRAWKNRSGGGWLALGVAAVLFGLAHAAGGLTYVALAAVAGMGYGWVYRRTGRIEASILTHFGLNTVHFLLFTYPALQR